MYKIENKPLYQFIPFFSLLLLLMLTMTVSYFLTLVSIVFLYPLINKYNLTFIFSIFFILILSFIQSNFIPDSDSLQYLDLFERGYYSEEINATKALEAGSLIYNKLLSLFISSDEFFLVNSFLLYSLLLFILIKVSPNNYFLLFVLICFMGFSNNINFLIRQYFSTLFILLSMIYVKENSFKSTLFFVLAATFHLSAIIYILVVFSFHFRCFLFNNKIKLIFIMFLLSFVINVDFFDLLYSYSNDMSIFGRFRYYTNIEMIRPLSYISIFINCILITYLFPDTKNNEKVTNLMSLMFFSLLFYIAFSGISVAATRLGFVVAYFSGLSFVVLLQKEKILALMKIDSSVFLYLFSVVLILYWGIANELTHIIKYFDGNILSSGFLGI